MKPNWQPKKERNSQRGTLQRRLFADRTGASVFFEDNIRAPAYRELLRGSGRGSRNFVCLAVRSGVGLGIVIDGKLYSGANVMAGKRLLNKGDGVSLSDIMSAAATATVLTIRIASRPGKL